MDRKRARLAATDPSGLRLLEVICRWIVRPGGPPSRPGRYLGSIQTRLMITHAAPELSPATGRLETRFEESLKFYCLIPNQTSSNVVLWVS